MKHHVKLMIPLCIAGVIGLAICLHQLKPAPPDTLRVLQISIGETEDLDQVKTSLEGFQRICRHDVDLPITLETLSVKNADEYLIKRNTLMLSKNAPDVIVTGGLPLEDLGKLDVLLPLEGELPNLIHLKKAFIGKYSVVAGYHLQSFTINTRLLEDLGLGQPSPNWQPMDLVKLIDTVKAKRPSAPVVLTRALYEVYFDAFLGDYLDGVLSQPVDAFSLNDPKFTKALAEMKQALKAHYDLSNVPSHSTRQRMMFDPKSSEYQAYVNEAMGTLTDGMAVIPNLNAMNTATLSRVYEKTPNIVVLPVGHQIETLKFGINRSSKHLSEAKAFVNAAIGWKAQYSYSIYSKTIRYAQVNSENEDRLNAYGAFFAKDTNAVQIRSEVLKQLDHGFYEDASENPNARRILKDALMQTCFDLIFDDSLADPLKAKKERQIVTDRIKLMLKE